jgi:hypothetical protein
MRHSSPRVDELSPRGRTFSDEIFAKGRGVATIYIPCDGPIESICRVRPSHLAEVDLATIVHAGSHRNIDLAYGALATHVARYEVARMGPCGSTTWWDRWILRMRAPGVPRSVGPSSASPSVLTPLKENAGLDT